MKTNTAISAIFEWHAAIIVFFMLLSGMYIFACLVSIMFLQEVIETAGIRVLPKVVNVMAYKTWHLDQPLSESIVTDDLK